MRYNFTLYLLTTNFFLNYLLAYFSTNHISVIHQPAFIWKLQFCIYRFRIRVYSKRKESPCDNGYSLAIPKGPKAAHKLAWMTAQSLADSSLSVASNVQRCC